MNKKIIVLLAIVACITGQIFAQNNDEIVASEIGIDTAQQKLKEVSVAKFEDAAFWYGTMSVDEGLIFIKRFAGGPLDKEPIPDEVELGIDEVEADEYVLGAKVEFFRRGAVNFNIRPIRPIPIEGIVKTISLWVAGRNYNHRIKLIIADHFGNYGELDMGRLNFSGWKKLTVAIPPNIVQRNYHYNSRMGIQILGFEIICDPEDTYGQYYVYFDDLRAVTDLFTEEARDVDDMVDAW